MLENQEVNEVIMTSNNIIEINVNEKNIMD